MTRPTRLPALAAALLVAAAAAGCVRLKRTPEARFFVLQPLAPAAAPAASVAPDASAAAKDTPLVVGLLPVRLPDHLRRPQLVLWAGPHEMRIDEFLRWGEPLEAGVARVLAADLASLLPAARVVRAPWPAALAPRGRVSVELRAFGPRSDGLVAVEGSWLVLSGGDERRLAGGSFAVSRAPAGGGREPGAVVGAMSELLGELARQIADPLRALPPASED